jgi:4-hydroxybenzoyl-CoA thioesterase
VGSPFVHVHRVLFDEIDAAGIVYFAHFFHWCHDAMAVMFDGLEGGYAGLVGPRRLGLPVVRAEADYASPVRFGDDVRVAVNVERTGRSSVVFRFDLTRAGDGTKLATIRHTTVLTDLAKMKSVAIPDDVMAVMDPHRG